MLRFPSSENLKNYLCLIHNKVFGITKPLTILFISTMYDTVVIPLCIPVPVCVIVFAIKSGSISRKLYYSYFIWFREKKFEIWSPLIVIIQFSSCTCCFHVKSVSSRRIAVHLTAHPLVVRALGRKGRISFCPFSFGITFTHLIKAHTHKCGTKARPLSWRALFEKAFLGNFPWKKFGLRWFPDNFPNPATKEKNNR